jgi:diguanylate cyclase (GGDEF)-like protein/PAS domain S-box-containing protein
LIALVALPSIGLIVYSGIAARHEAIAGARTECLKLVSDIAGQQQALVAGAEQLATALSLLPPIQSRKPAAANALFSDLLKKNPQYGNIAVMDKSGLVWASARPFEGKVSMADRRFFQEAVRTGMFSSGEYVVARIAKKPAMSFGYPVKNAAHELVAVIGIILDLEYSQRIFEKLNLPAGSLLALLDRGGIILVRNVNDSEENLSGRRDPQRELFTRMTEGPDEGTFEATGNDGRFRIRAYKKMRLPNESEPYLYIRAGIPLASATSKTNTALFRNLSAFVSLFLMGLSLAWLIGRRLIVNPAMTLKGASERLAAGLDTVHVSSIVKGGELGEVALAFDGMAAALVQRETALRINEQRWATTLASIGDAVIATDVEGKITFMNAVAEELTGWTLGEASMKPVAEVFHIIDERSRTEAESPVAKVLRQRMIVGLADHTILVRKDGTGVPVDDSGAPIRDAEGRTMGVVLVFRDITERKQALQALEESENKFRDLVEKAMVGVYLVQRGVFQYVNAKFADIHGYDDPEMMHGLDARKTILPEDLPPIEGVDEWIKGEDMSHRRQFRIVRKDGKTRYVEAYGRYTTYQGKPAIIGMAIDVTDRRNAEETLQWKTTFLEALVHSSHDGILILDNRMQKVLQNDRLVQMLKMPQDIAETEDEAQRIKFLMRAIKDPRDFYGKLMYLYNHSGEIIKSEFELKDGTVVDTFSYPVTGKDGGEQYGRIWMFRDITEVRRYWDILESLSTTDGLTEISNRRRFDEFLEREWLRSMREHAELSLILIDIDYFKQFNDRYGHLAGDECLKQVAGVLKKTVQRAGDLAARYGGEEFACILPRTEQKRAGIVAQKIADEIAGLRIRHEGSAVADHVTISIGLATLVPERGQEYSDLIRMADQNLYSAKQRGRNRVAALPGDNDNEGGKR